MGSSTTHYNMTLLFFQSMWEILRLMSLSVMAKILIGLLRNINTDTVKSVDAWLQDSYF